MRDKIGLSVLVVGALFCLLTAWLSATSPVVFAERLGLKVLNAGGINEIRAQYAGFFFAVAVACTAALLGFLSREFAYLILITVFGGLLAGRIVSVIMNWGIEGYGPTIVSLYVIDTVGLTLAVTAYIVSKPRA
jgi:hypothetical protein